MKIEMSQAAADFYRDEVNPGPGKGIHIYGKVYGSTNVHGNYSVGIMIEEPVNPFATAELGDILVFAEEEDRWFFGDYYLVIDYQAGDDAPTYTFTSDDPELAADAASGASTADPTHP